MVFANALLHNVRASVNRRGFGEALAEQLAHPIGLVHIVLKRFPTLRVQFCKLLRIHFVPVYLTAAPPEPHGGGPAAASSHPSAPTSSLAPLPSRCRPPPAVILFFVLRRG